MLTIVPEVLRHGTAGVGSQELQRCSLANGFESHATAAAQMPIRFRLCGQTQDDSAISGSQTSEAVAATTVVYFKQSLQRAQRCLEDVTPSPTAKVL